MVRTELFCHTRASRTKTALLAVTFAGRMLISPAFSQSPAQASPPIFASATVAATDKPSPKVETPTRYLPNRAPRREVAYYEMLWGVDSLTVKAVESGELIRFSYRVLDADKAKLLNDKKVDAYLFAPEARARLVVPSLEKVGMLRQSNTPEPGKAYWMAFSNPGRTVKRGDRVNVVIGHFQAEGLVVE